MFDAHTRVHRNVAEDGEKGRHHSDQKRLRRRRSVSRPIEPLSLGRRFPVNRYGTRPRRLSAVSLLSPYPPPTAPMADCVLILFFATVDSHKLCRAANLNNTDMLKQLLDTGVSPNCRDSRRRTPLHLAASKGYAKAVGYKHVLHSAAPHTFCSVVRPNTPVYYSVF